MVLLIKAMNTVLITTYVSEVISVRMGFIAARFKQITRNTFKADSDSGSVAVFYNRMFYGHFAPVTQPSILERGMSYLKRACFGLWLIDRQIACSRPFQVHKWRVTRNGSLIRRTEKDGGCTDFTTIPFEPNTANYTDYTTT